VRKILKYFLIFFFFLILLAIKQNSAFADYEIILDPVLSITSDQLTSSPDYLKPCSPGEQGCVDSLIPNENTKTILVKFTGLTPQKYKLCLFNDDFFCKDDGLMDTADIASTGDSAELTVPVCADGKENLKFAKKDETDNTFNPKSSDDVNPNSWSNFHCSEDDYFWGQKTYKLRLYTKDKNLLYEVPLYIAHYYPMVTINDTDIIINADSDNSFPSLKLSPDTPIKVQIKGNRRAFDKDGRNNYKIEIATQDNPGDLWGYACVTVKIPAGGDPKDGGGISEIANINGNTEGIKLPEGAYILKINERVNEGNPLHSKCNAGFSYYYIGFTVRRGGGGEIQYAQVDPHGEDIQRVNKTWPVPLVPCLDTDIDPINGCLRIQTAIGPIETTPGGFVKSVFSLVLGLAGGLALLLIIYSGFQLIESRGNPEKLETAREQLTSAIIGLLFIIFSLVIIQFLGVDILKLPGLGR